MPAPGESRTIPLTGPSLDRHSELSPSPERIHQLLANPDTGIIVVSDTDTLVLSTPAGGPVTTSPDAHLLVLGPAVASGYADDPLVYLGRDVDGSWPDRPRNAAYFALVASPATMAQLTVKPSAAAGHIGPDVATEAPPLGQAQRVPLREIGTQLSPVEAAAAATAIAMAHWHTSHTHCPHCGALTRIEQAGWVRRCIAENLEVFPRTDPAMIVAVTDDADRLLLAHGSRFQERGYSILAGFVEPGESLEAAVVREIAEEVGVAVTDVRYVASQPWPFPRSLMLGFTARAVGDLGLTPQAGEILDARWFTRDELDKAVAADEIRLPGSISIARLLVQDWYGGPLPEPDPMVRNVS